jgi:hypothetical protein
MRPLECNQQVLFVNHLKSAPIINHDSSNKICNHAHVSTFTRINAVCSHIPFNERFQSYRLSIILAPILLDRMKTDKFSTFHTTLLCVVPFLDNKVLIIKLNFNVTCLYL